MSKYTPFNLFMRQAQLYPLTSPFLPPVDKVEKDHSYANGHLIGTLEAAGEIGLPKTGQVDSSRTGDDGDIQAGLPSTGSRFTDNDDGTVTDNTTGLMYVNNISSLGSPFYSGGMQQALSWNDAIDACNALDFAGYDDWRLTNIFELIVIADLNKSYPFFDDGVFTMASNDHYWSSSRKKTNSSSAYVVQFAYDIIFTSASKGNSNYALPVRNV
jgi:hypothetical protein